MHEMSSLQLMMIRVYVLEKNPVNEGIILPVMYGKIVLGVLGALLNMRRSWHLLQNPRSSALTVIRMTSIDLK